jgi:hypothetical protein
MKKRQVTAVNTLRTVEDWGKKHRLGISKDKSALMPMFIGNRELYRVILSVLDRRNAKSGSLSLLGPSVTVQACNGSA